jgi:hypothetical protein
VIAFGFLEEKTRLFCVQTGAQYVVERRPLELIDAAGELPVQSSFCACDGFGTEPFDH